VRHEMAAASCRAAEPDKNYDGTAAAAVPHPKLEFTPPGWCQWSVQSNKVQHVAPQLIPLPRSYSCAPLPNKSKSKWRKFFSSSRKWRKFFSSFDTKKKPGGNPVCISRQVDEFECKMSSRFDKLMMAGLSTAVINNVVSSYFSGFATQPAAMCRDRL